MKTHLDPNSYRLPPQPLTRRKTIPWLFTCWVFGWTLVGVVSLSAIVERWPKAHVRQLAHTAPIEAVLPVATEKTTLSASSAAALAASFRHQEAPAPRQPAPQPQLDQAVISWFASAQKQ